MIAQHHRGERRGVLVTVRAAGGGHAPPWHHGVFEFALVIGGHETWSATFEVQPIVAGETISATFPVEKPITDAPPVQRAREWENKVPSVESADEGLIRTLTTSRRDLGALRIMDPQEPSMVAVAAGAPWFMALFGRDSLFASLMALPLDPSLALGTLQTLARHQGTAEDPETEEEPGRILHEVRLGTEARLTLGGGTIYYGTADATPLFVMLLGELCRWGLGEAYRD